MCSCSFKMTESEPLISPTSILEPFSSKNPFSSESPKVFQQNKHSWENLDFIGIGVALISDDEIPNQSTTKSIIFCKPSNKIVLFGTNLKVQIPPISNNFTADSPKSPGDFGIKTRNSQFFRSGFANSPPEFTGCVSMNELELSEDYTCVISYGPNPKTTHIYHNCVHNSFLSFCHTCKKKLEQKNDIFIYRGDKAFCSEECRYREMLLDGIES